MIERILKRFSGAQSYGEGVQTKRLATLKTNGTTFATTIYEAPQGSIPMLATIKNRKQTVPYEDEVELHFEISYKNQDDVTHTAWCAIPVYAEKDLDFRINMEESNDFVKEILSISPRTGHTSKKGNIGDTVEIVGLVGNIAKIHGANSIILSEALYQVRVASLQKYVQMAFDSGLKLLAKSYNLNLGSTYSTVDFRLFTRLFSTYVVPAKTVMQESMSKIYEVLDPEGYIEVSGNFTSPYEMIVDVYTSTLNPTFTENDIEILLLFANRYRPVPATASINVVFPANSEDSIIGESGTVEINEGTIKFGETAIFNATTIFGDAAFTSEPDLPTDYP